MFNYLSKFLGKNQSYKLSLSTSAKKIYLTASLASKSFIFSSSNGFDFNLNKTKLKAKLLKPAIQDNFEYLHLLAPGSENLSVDNLTIQAFIANKDGRYLFYHYQKNNRFEVSFIVLDDQGQVTWRHTQPIWQSPLD